MVRVHGDDPGEIAGLDLLLRQHGGAVEADLLRFYGLRLGELFRGNLSPRLLINLIEQLPPDSALAAAQHGEIATWDVATGILALIADNTAIANWQRASARSKTKLPPPTPVPRPGKAAKPDIKQVVTAEMLRDFAARHSKDS